MAHKILTFLILILTAREAVARDWARFALVVGTNRGTRQENALQFAEQDADRFAALLSGPGQVPDQGLMLLKGPRRGEFTRGLEQLEQRIREAEDRGESSLLIVYFSGHSDGKNLQFGNELEPFSELRSRVEASRATLKLLIVDSCQSGGLTGLKGMVPTLDVDVWLKGDTDARGMVIITSTATGEFAQESVQLEASYFTHNLIWGLRGAADVDQSGTVTLAEAYNYAYSETVNRTWSTMAGRQHPTIELNLDQRGDVTLTDLREQDCTLVFDSRSSGEFAVLDPRSGQLIAEVRKPRGTRQELAVAAGSYWISRKQGERILVQKLSLEPATQVLVNPEAMVDHTGVVQAKRKASEGRVRGPLQLMALYGLGSGWLGKTSAVHHGSLGLRADLGSFSLIPRVTWGRTWGYGDLPIDTLQKFQVDGLTLETWLAWRFEVSILDMFAGMNLGWAWMKQIIDTDSPFFGPEEHLGSSLILGAVFGVDVPLGKGLSLEMFWEANEMVFQLDQERRLSAGLFFKGSAGIGYRF